MSQLLFYYVSGGKVSVRKFISFFFACAVFHDIILVCWKKGDKMGETYMKDNLFLHLWKKYVTKELIIYGIVGVLTTVVNWIVSYLFNNILQTDVVITNSIAWIAAVTFAYIMNDRVVFHVGYHGLKKEMDKIWKFTFSRLITLVIEVGGGALFVKSLGFPYWPVKVSISVIVILLNYIFSKLFVFIKDKGQTEEK